MTSNGRPTREERIARKVSLAQERDTRVVVTRTNDTHRILDIVRSADRGIRHLRANLLIRYVPEDVIPLLDEYQKAVSALHLATAKICLKAGIPYRPPSGFDLPPVVGDSQEAKVDKVVDEIMEAAYTSTGSHKNKK